MPFNGAGVYSAPSSPGAFNPALAGQQATPDSWNTLLADISTALSLVICRDGQSTVTADISLDTHKLIDVAPATLATDAVNASQIITSGISAADDTGTADAYAIAPAIAIVAYAAYQRFQFKAAHTNTGASTLAVSSLATKAIKHLNGTALLAADIVSGAIIDVQYDGTAFQLLSATGMRGTVSTWTAAQTFTGNLTATAGTNAFTGTVVAASASTATTQAQADNSTKLATDAYVDRVGVQQTLSTITGAVATGSTVLPLDDSIPQSGEGNEYMTLAITPKSATSTLLVTVVAQASQNLGGANNITMALFRDAGADAVAAIYETSSNQFEGVNLRLTYAVASGSTSATTFKVRIGPSSAAVITFNGAASARLMGGVMASSIVIQEIGI